MPEYEKYDREKHGRDTPQETFGPVVMVDKLEGGKIHLITMNRPHRMNSMGDGLPQGIYDAFIDYRDDPTARVAIITGAGRAFSAGGDLIATSEGRQTDTEQAATDRRRRRGIPADSPSLSPLSEGMGLWKPTIAAVNGYAIAGGFMIAMQCDIRVVAEEARVGIGEVRWNMGGAGWMVPVTRQVGLGNALELTLWGDTQWTGRHAFETGWAQAVVPLEQLMDKAMEYANRAIDMAPQAVRNNKEAMYRGYYMTPPVGEAFGAGLEQSLDGMQDSLEGPTAFSEKRRPNFTDS